jgi:hypothetical protein
MNIQNCAIVDNGNFGVVLDHQLQKDDKLEFEDETSFKDFETKVSAFGPISNGGRHIC